METKTTSQDCKDNNECTANQRRKNKEPSNYVNIFEIKANANEIIIGALGKGKSFNIDNQPNEKAIFSNSSSEIFSSTSKEA